jgi:hypothetical protein
VIFGSFVIAPPRRTTPARDRHPQPKSRGRGFIKPRSIGFDRPLLCRMRGLCLRLRAFSESRYLRAHARARRSTAVKSRRNMTLQNHDRPRHDCRAYVLKRLFSTTNKTSTYLSSARLSTQTLYKIALSTLHGDFDLLSTFR